MKLYILLLFTCFYFSNSVPETEESIQDGWVKVPELSTVGVRAEESENLLGDEKSIQPETEESIQDGWVKVPELSTVGVRAEESENLLGDEEGWTVLTAEDFPGAGKLVRSADQSRLVPYSKLTEAWKYADMAYKRQHRPDHKLAIFEQELAAGTGITFFGHNHIVFEKSDGRIVVSYQGTTNMNDVYTDVCFRGHYSSDTGLSGHSGFLHRYDESREQLHLILESLAKKQKKSLEHIEVLFTGHSLGGALAQIAAADLAINRKLSSELITFAAPRALSVTSVQQALDTNLIRNPIRIVSMLDYVPNILPEFLTGYRGLGTTIIIGHLSYMNNDTNPAKAHKMASYQANLPVLEAIITDEGYSTPGNLNLALYEKNNPLRDYRAYVHKHVETPFLWALNWLFGW